MEHKWKTCQSKLSSFFSGKRTEKWWKSGGRNSETYIDTRSPKINYSKQQKSGFDPAWVCFQVFLNFYSDKRTGFIQTLLKIIWEIPSNILHRHNFCRALSHVNTPCRPSLNPSENIGCWPGGDCSNLMGLTNLKYVRPNQRLNFLSTDLLTLG